MLEHPSADATTTHAVEVPKQQSWILPAVLLLTFAVFAPSIGYQFVYDDESQVLNNPQILSWSSFPHYFTANAWSHLWTSTGFYRPLFLVWLRLNYWIFGRTPWGWHLSTIVVHLIATTLVFLLADRLGGRKIALITALIFGLHPAHVESVSWIAGVTDPLYTSLVIGSLLAWMKLRENSRALWHITSLALYACALLTKETSIIEPFFIFGLAWLLPSQNSVRPTSSNRLRRSLLTVSPFAAVTAIYLIIRWRVLAGQPTALPGVAAILTIPYLLWTYITHLVWPFGLSGFYDLEPVRNLGFLNFYFPSLALLAAGALIALAIRHLRLGKGEEKFNSSPFVLPIALLFLVFPLLPVLNLAQMQDNNFFHDRYLYLSVLGIGMLAAVAVEKLKGPIRVFNFNGAQAVTVLGLTLALGLGTLAGSRIWQNDVTLYLDAIKSAPKNPIPPSNLAALLIKLRRYDEAIGLLQRVVQQHPQFYPAYENLGECYAGLHELGRAAGYYERAYALFPDARLLEKLEKTRSLQTHSP